MRSETRKLAGIATVVCGGMASLGAGAVESDLPAVAVGRILLPEGALPEPADAQVASAPDAEQSTDATVTADAVPTPEVVQTAEIAPAAEAVPIADAKALAEATPPVKAPPLFYAAPVIVLERADTPVEPKAERAIPTGEAKPPAKNAPLSYAAPVMVSARADKPVELKVERAIPLAEATPVVEATARPLSYAAPIIVPPRADKPALAKSARPKDDPNWLSGDTVALSEERLDNMRGGFDLPSGLKVSFGISRVAFVNGNLVMTTNFNIPDVSMMTAQQAQALVAANTGALIQNGHGNVVQAASLPALTGSIIQNTLNNQHIQALTTINTSVNSLAIFQNMNIMSTLNNALTSAVRGK